ncbi:GNAT family N-acetyltransferase [Clostridium cylindrosporum]|uniref:GCN5-like N-acetyltransferase n=1 Tax=Clostridium cylindrosporum DSM 605 TaxID=1121307 RepID=A0A0J8D9R3_CLOCY|nr:GNAT family N-acetyltransferase [Clostridium cylindrosporum]KMT21023.1 GCN5-like N-acetyltransferase [Clostridium cylindrosporum DSM 605]
MIRELQQQDKDIFINMVKDFYNSEAVLHPIPEKNIVKTYNEIISSSPYAKAYIIEENNEVAGYSQISLTYSNEAGGIVVWIEEIYIREQFRGLGLGSKILDFINTEFSDKAARFRLEICEDNKSAKKLYIRKGYKTLNYSQMVYGFDDN